MLWSAAEVSERRIWQVGAVEASAACFLRAFPSNHAGKQIEVLPSESPYQPSPIMKAHSYNRSVGNDILVIIHPDLLDEWGQLVRNHEFEVVSENELQKLPATNPPQFGHCFEVKCPPGTKVALESFVLKYS